MTQTVSWLIDLNGLQFAEDDGPKWIQAMPIGKYKHPLYGVIEFTADRVQRFAANVKKKVRGQDLDIDYDHKERSGEAAGWVQDADVRLGDPDPRNNGLWILVDFTSKAKELIKEKAYRYFSPEFVDEWENPIDGQTYKDVLFGGGITNRPFLKNIVPLNLSEAFLTDQLQEGGRTVDPDQLKAVAKLLGLPDDATGDQILGALQVTLKVPGNTDPSDPADPDASSGADDGDKNKKDGLVGAGAGAIGMSEDIKKLAESNPTIKLLVEMVNTQAEQLAENTKQLKEARVGAALKQLSEKARDKGWAIPPVTTNALKEILEEAPKQFSDKVIQAFDTLMDKGLVQLGENGGRKREPESDGATDFMKEVNKLRESNKGMSFGEASVQVAQERPELFAAYQAASYSNDK